MHATSTVPSTDMLNARSQHVTIPILAQRLPWRQPLEMNLGDMYEIQDMGILQAELRMLRLTEDSDDGDEARELLQDALREHIDSLSPDLAIGIR